jgi:hypothetical protein
MLFLFRKSQRVLLWILLVVVIITFVGFYGKSYLPQRKKVIFGTYKGKNIYDDDIARAVRGALVFRRLANIPIESSTNPEELEREGVQLLIRVDQAKSAGLAVSDEEIRALIERLFPPGILSSIVSYQQAIARLTGIPMKPREFEEHLRNILLIEKVRQYLMTTVLITEDEVKQQYDIDNSLIKIAYVPFFFKDFLAGLTVTTNEVEAFFNTSPEEFRMPNQVEIIAGLVEIDPDGVTIEEEELKEYYEENTDYFVVTNAVAETEDTSSDITVDEDVDDTEYRPYEEVKEEIRVAITDQRAREIATDKMNMLEFALLDSPISDAEARIDVFRKKADETGIPVIESGLVALEGTIPGITNSYEVIKAALNMELGAQSTVFTIPDKGYLIFIVKEKKESYIPELEECFQDVVKEVKNRRAFEAARIMAEQVNKQIKASSNDFVTAAESLGYTVRTSVPLNRQTGLTDINCPPRMVANLFAFPVEFPIVLPFMDGFLVAANLEIIPADYDLLALSDEGNPRQMLSAQSLNVLMSFLYAQAEQDFRIYKPVDQVPAPGSEPGAAPDTAPVPEQSPVPEAPVE